MFRNPDFLIVNARETLSTSVGSKDTENPTESSWSSQSRQEAIGARGFGSRALKSRGGAIRDPTYR